MSDFICPICNAEYSQKPKICTCGFEGIEYIDYYNPLRYDEGSQNTVFKIYKFSKKVAMGEINFKPSPLSIIDTDNIFIDEILEKRGLAYVYAPDMILSEGVLAQRTNVQSLIADVKGAQALFLDESHIKMLFLGEHFKTLTKGFFIPLSALRYIWVDSKNQHFYAENNVLFNKEKTKLICYARMRPEEEYTVPATVRHLKKYSFFYPKHLKKLYIHKSTQIEDNALIFYNDSKPEIIYI